MNIGELLRNHILPYILIYKWTYLSLIAVLDELRLFHVLTKVILELWTSRSDYSEERKKKLQGLYRKGLHAATQFGPEWCKTDPAHAEERLSFSISKSPQNLFI